jgi:hypothetical protein
MKGSDVRTGRSELALRKRTTRKDGRGGTIRSTIAAVESNEESPTVQAPAVQTVLPVPTATRRKEESRN